MTEIINATIAQQQPIDPRPLYFVKMFKDGSYTCTLADRQEDEQCTMELEYIPQPPTDEEKIQYAIQNEPVILNLPATFSMDIKRSMAVEIIKGYAPDMVLFDPNASRVHDDPTYFFKTPAKPVIWCWKRGTQEEAIATAEAYRQKMLGSGKWDMVVKVYKEQYNVMEA
jgi:hypothetical protein